jgi:hypothetical protein
MTTPLPVCHISSPRARSDQVGAPEKFRQEDLQRLMALAQQHQVRAHFYIYIYIYRNSFLHVVCRTVKRENVSEWNVPLTGLAPAPPHPRLPQKHEWEAVSRALATGHSAIQCLREYQRRTALQQAGGGLYKKGTWMRDEDARLAEAVGMYADNWTLISQHVQTRTAAQCRFRYVPRNAMPFHVTSRRIVSCRVASRHHAVEGA